MQKEQIKFDIPKLQFNMKKLEGNNSLLWRGTHMHTAVEMICVNYGKLSCCIDNQDIIISPGNVLFINSEVAHRLYTTKWVSFTYIQVTLNANRETGSFIYDFAARADNKKYFIAQKDSALFRLFSDMRREMEEKYEYFEEYIKADIIKLSAFLHRYKIINPPEEKTILKIERILPVIKYIENNYNEEVTLEALGKLIGCDKFSLCRKFKAATNGTVIEYLNYVRLKNAEIFLLYSDKNISEIAFLCGFSSIQYFNKVFKKYMGCSPGKLRAACSSSDTFTVTGLQP